MHIKLKPRTKYKCVVCNRVYRNFRDKQIVTAPIYELFFCFKFLGLIKNGIGES